MLVLVHALVAGQRRAAVKQDRGAALPHPHAQTVVRPDHQVLAAQRLDHRGGQRRIQGDAVAVGIEPPDGVALLGTLRRQHEAAPVGRDRAVSHRLQQQHRGFLLAVLLGGEGTAVGDQGERGSESALAHRAHVVQKAGPSGGAMVLDPLPDIVARQIEHQRRAGRGVEPDSAAPAEVERPAGQVDGIGTKLARTVKLVRNLPGRLLGGIGRLPGRHREEQPRASQNHGPGGHRVPTGSRNWARPAPGTILVRDAGNRVAPVDA